LSIPFLGQEIGEPARRPDHLSSDTFRLPLVVDDSPAAPDLSAFLLRRSSEIPDEAGGGQGKVASLDVIPHVDGLE